MQPQPKNSLSPIVPALRRARSRSVLRRPVIAWRHRSLENCDTMLVSFPRSGSTWLRFMLAAAISTEPVDFDSVDEIIPFVGAPPGDDAARWGTAGHLIKSHERFSRHYVKDRRRFIYLIRDGRDVAVSYFYFCLRHGRWAGTFPDFLDAFLSGRLDGYGSWQSHVEGWLEGGGGSEHILVRYEDLHRDAETELRRCTEFLRSPLEQKQLERGLAAGSADRMRGIEKKSVRTVADPSIPNVRSTKSSNWRQEFSGEDLAKFQRLTSRAFELGGYV